MVKSGIGTSFSGIVISISGIVNENSGMSYPLPSSRRRSNVLMPSRPPMQALAK